MRETTHKKAYTSARVCAAVLAFVLFFVAMPFRAPVQAASNIALIRGLSGYDFTENTYIAQKLTSLFELLPYSDYPYFTTYGYKSCGNSICTYCNVANVSAQHPNLKDLGVVDNYAAYSCFGFARWAFLYIFGISANGLNYYGNVTEDCNLQRVGRLSTRSVSGFSGDYDDYTLEKFKALLADATPGDILQAHTSSNTNHTMIFLGYDDEGFYVLHNNAFKTSVGEDGKEYSNNRVLVSKYIYESFMGTWDRYVSLLRAEPETYADIWSRGANVCEDHIFTQESCGICTNCGYRYVCQTDGKDIGTYVLKANTALRSLPYSLSNAPLSAASGDRIAVTNSLTNAFGELWFRTAEGYYLKSEEAEKTGDAAGTITISPDAFPSGNLVLGKSFNIYGMISTTAGSISKVYGALIGEDGTIRQSTIVNPASVTLSIYYSNINYKLKFANLPLGKHYFMVAAYDTAGGLSVSVSTFEIVNEGDARTKPRAPSAPTLESKTSESVTLVKTDGYEYRVDSLAWQKSNVFTGLTPATEYSFSQRIPESTTNLASDASASLRVTTDAPLPDAPEKPGVEAVTDTSVTLVQSEGFEYCMDEGEWQTSSLFDNLTPGSTHLFTCRLAKEPELVSDPVSVTLPKKASETTPAEPVATEITASSVTLEAVSGCEYSVNGGEWQASPVFTNLSPATPYTFSVRYAGTETSEPSDAAGAVFTTDKTTQQKPALPTAGTVTSSSITLASISGCEYSIEGGEWQSSTTFANLSPVTAYTISARYAETATAYPSESVSVIIKTDKTTQQKPSAPTAETVTSSSVTLASIAGCEYSINGGEWQSSTTFANLSPATEYTFSARYAETESAYPSEAAGVTVKTDKASQQKPSIPTAQTVTSSSITLASISGCEYSIEGGEWQSSTVFANLSPVTSYTFSARYAETETAYPSESVSVTLTTDKASQQKPSTPAAETITSSSVTLVLLPGCEYSIEGGEWQTSTTFANLSPATEYTFSARYTQTATAYPSEPSGVTIKTDKATQQKPSAPTIASATSSKVVLTATNGCEYSKDGKTWQSSNVFDGLSPYTELKFYARRAATSTAYASGASTATSTVLYSETLHCSKYTLSQGKRFVSGIGTSVTVKDLLASFAESKYMTVLDSSGNTVNDTAQKVKTGMRFCTYNGKNLVSEYTAVVTGDVNGDGEINIADMMAIKAISLGTGATDAASVAAADVNGDGDVNIADFIKAKAATLGICDIDPVSI